MGDLKPKDTRAETSPSCRHRRGSRTTVLIGAITCSGTLPEQTPEIKTIRLLSALRQSLESGAGLCNSFKTIVHSHCLRQHLCCDSKLCISIHSSVIMRIDIRLGCCSSCGTSLEASLCFSNMACADCLSYPAQPSVKGRC
ncbi:hypothetical protein BJX70DRAFT_103150 [Aspergillus crustosus]